jgi:hypothetical protein
VRCASAQIFKEKSADRAAPARSPMVLHQLRPRRGGRSGVAGKESA